MNLREHLDAIAVAVTAIIGAVAAFVYRTLKAKGEHAVLKGQAHGEHADAAIKEARARLTLDDATRDWAQALIDRYDAENEELRAVIAAAREEFRLERAAWECRVADLSRQVDILRQRVAELKTENTLLKLGVLRQCGVETEDTR